MATPGNSLFLLIKSMSKTEKRHFKLSMAGFGAGKEKGYLLLFDAIDSQAVYNEEVIKKQLADKVNLRHFARTKVYLYNQVLKSLRGYNEGQSYEIELNNHLTDIEILFNKQLFADCRDRIKKARQLATRFEKFHHLLRLYHWEMVLADYVSRPSEVELVKKHAIEQQETVLNTYSQYSRLWKLYLEALSVSLTTGQASGQEELNRANSIAGHPLLQHKLPSQAVENLRLTVLVHQAYLKGDTVEMHRLMTETVKLTEAYPHLLAERVTVFFQNLGALARICLVLHKTREARHYLQKLKDLARTYAGKIKFDTQPSIIAMEMEVLKKEGSYHEAVQLIPELIRMNEASANKTEPIDELLFYYSVFSAYFGHGNYKEAQFYLQKVIDTPHRDVLPNFQHQARVVNLLLQYEQKEFVYLRNLLQTTYRYLYKRKKMLRTEMLLLNFFKRAIAFTSAAQHTAALAELKQELVPLSDQPFERNLFANFPLIEWIDSKLQKKSLAEVKQQKLATSNFEN
jgi:hypothetical protein